LRYANELYFRLILWQDNFNPGILNFESNELVTIIVIIIIIIIIIGLSLYISKSATDTNRLQLVPNSAARAVI